MSTHSELREMNFGIAEGRSSQEVRQEYADLFKLIDKYNDAKSHDICLPGAETRRQAFNRTSQKMFQLIDQGPEGTLAFSTHGRVLNSILLIMFNEPVIIQTGQVVQFSFSNRRRSFSSYKILE